MFLCVVRNVSDPYYFSYGSIRFIAKQKEIHVLRRHAVGRWALNAVCARVVIGALRDSFRGV